MKLKLLSIFEFDNFAKNHPLGSYHQSSKYALLMAEQGYDYELIGLVDRENKIHAAALILYKSLNMFCRYGYSPKGFLIDYYNTELLEEFLNLIKKRYYRKNFAFIKINPEIAIGAVDYKTKTIKYNKNKNIDLNLRKLGCIKHEGDMHFESKLPRFNAIEVLKNSNFNDYDKNTRNKIKKAIKNGLTFSKGTRENIENIFEFIKRKKDHNIFHYYNYYNAFQQNDNIDIFIVKMNFEKSLISLRKRYEKELDKNNLIVKKVMANATKENLQKKLESDKKLTSINEDIGNITKDLSKENEKIIAGCITIKYKNRVYILISGYDPKYKQFAPNYYLHYKLIEYYKNNFDYLDLNGITGDFSKTNPYHGLDKFKLSFQPLAFEYIGEYDFIINKGLYDTMNQSGELSKEFKKEKIRTKEYL